MSTYCGLGALLVLTEAAAGQVVLDGSLGPQGALTGPDFQITSGLGTLAGQNLFHSFSTFNLSATESATFSGPGSVANVFSRVTGGQASTIDGTLGCSIPGANLYFINPYGVLFGENARLDVSGSFVVSTADYLKMGEDGRFDATTPAQSLLTSSPVEAFGFLGDDSGSIELQSSQLQVNAGQQLSLVGGDATLEGATLTAVDGDVRILSVSSAGEFSLPTAGSIEPWALPDGGVLGDIELTQATEVNVSGEGEIWIRGGRVVLEAASVSHVNEGAGDGGKIDLAASGEVSVRDGSVIRALNTQAGAGAALRIQSDTLRVESGSGIYTEATETALGKGGELQLESREIELTDTARVSSITTGAAPGGDVHLEAELLQIDAQEIDDTSNDHVFTTTRSTGRGGDLSVNVDTIRLFNGAELSATTFGLGDAGDIHVSTEDLLVDATFERDFDNPDDYTGTGISSRSESTADGGAGSVLIEAGRITLEAGNLSVSTRGNGAGGSLHVVADQLSINGEGVATGLFAQSLSTDQPGQGGELRVDARLIEISSEGRIQSSTFGPGNAGNITVRAEDITIDGREHRFAPFTLVGINAQSVNEGVGGNAGTMLIEAERFNILGAGGVSASTQGLGNAGDVLIRAGEISIDGEDTLAGIFASTENPGAGGAAGNLTIETDRLELINHGQISAHTSGQGRGGNLVIRAGDILMDDIAGPWEGFFDVFTGIFATSLSSGLGGPAGEVTIDAGQLTILNGAQIQTGTSGLGDGGTLTIRTTDLLMDGPGKFTAISANSFSGGPGGNAGNLVLETETMQLLGWSQINSLTFGEGNAATVTVTANDILVDNLGLSDIGGQTPIAGFLAQSLQFLSPNGGQAGDLNITAQTLQLINWSVVNATTFNAGAAGNVTVNADHLVIDGPGFADSGIFARNIIGEGGDIMVDVSDRLELLHGGQISASTFGSAKGGAVTVDARTVQITGGAVQTGISAQSFLLPTVFNSPAEGAGGLVTVRADQLSVTEGGSISAGTARDGEGGNVAIEAGTISLTERGSIESSSSGAGSAGQIDITTTGSFSLAGGSSVATSAQMSDGGDIGIAAGTNIKLLNSQVTAQAANNGGNIRISAPDRVYLLKSQVTAAAGNDGGNVDLSSSLAVLNGSVISANAVTGDGGDVLIAADFFLPSVDSSVTASSEFGLAGRISLLGPAIDLSGSLTPLEPSLADYGNELPPHCGVNVGQQLSTFVVTGVGGIPPTPAGWQPVWPSPSVPLLDLGPARR